MIVGSGSANRRKYNSGRSGLAVRCNGRCSVCIHLIVIPDGIGISNRVNDRNILMIFERKFYIDGTALRNFEPISILLDTEVGIVNPAACSIIINIDISTVRFTHSFDICNQIICTGRIVYSVCNRVRESDKSTSCTVCRNRCLRNRSQSRHRRGICRV